MPPVKRSTTTRGYNDGDDIEVDESQSDTSSDLGEYHFDVVRSSVPGSSNDQITAICTKGDKSARKSIQVPSSLQMLSWRVEANETEASVYATFKGAGNVPCAPSAELDRRVEGSGNTYNFISGTGEITISAASVGSATQSVLMASQNPGASVDMYAKKGHEHTTINLAATYTLLGKTVYYAIQTSSDSASPVIAAHPTYSGPLNGNTAWAMIYGGENIEMLVGRFAIDLGDAGGGPEDSYPDPDDWGDWDDPGDYDPEEPTYTLYVDVTGAYGGRYNDPLGDTSYSYLPIEPQVAKDGGFGGHGGHGGGGGSGASTVVIHKFATSKANSKELTAYVRGHGYGSGGGKGGKGGYGAVLIYY